VDNRLIASACPARAAPERIRGGRIQARWFMPTGFVLANYPQTHVTDGCVRYAARPLPIKSRRCGPLCAKSCRSRNVRVGCAPCKGGAFQWVQIPSGNRSNRKQSEQSWR
jgi:hypothetical protein